ncbi:MAG TPA: GntR family transcriptional regulator [Chthoniobacteraceae bacterium]|nr:GntR family transcriptional regulator [Chthoniobacteraceae bacterium]
MTHNLAEMVRHCLSRPPSRVGDRMRPERELAGEFGMSRRKVREAIDDLVAAQVLVREHGSGVYVRKIPAPAETGMPAGEPIAFERLFVREPSRARLQIPASKRSLAFEVWWKTAFDNDLAKLFKKGLKDQAESLGHQLLIHELPSGSEPGNVAAEILAQMSQRHCDGYIIHAPFAYALDRIKELIAAPVIYVSAGRQPLRHQPMVRLDGTESVEHAMELLKEQGFRRIGMLAMKPPYSVVPEASHQQTYASAMKTLGLTFRRYERVPMEEAPVAAALKRLLVKRPSCDALYITDDYLLRMALPMLEKMGFHIGKNLGAIVLSNRGSELPAGTDWSRMEFDPYNNGKLAITCLIRSVESAGEELLSFSHHPAWRPGQTHLRVEVS